MSGSDKAITFTPDKGFNFLDEYATLYVLSSPQDEGVRLFPEGNS